MTKRILQVLAGSLLGLIAALLVLWPGAGRTPGAAAAAPGAEFLLPEPLPAPDFELVDQTGRPVRLHELGAGRALVLFFGFTHCPDVCPTTMASLARARELLGADGERVAATLVTVDPERDTPERLAAYLDGFGPGLIGLTGDTATLAAARRAYLVHAERGAPMEHGGYGMDHTGRSFVVHDGAVRMTFPPFTGGDAMAAALALLLDS